MRQLNLNQLPSSIYLTTDQDLTVLCVFEFNLDQYQRFMELTEHFEFFYCQFNQTNSMIPSDCFTNISQHVPISIAWHQITSLHHNNIQTIIPSNHQIVAKIQGKELLEFIKENQEDFPEIFFKKENHQQSEKTSKKNSQCDSLCLNETTQRIDFLDQIEQIINMDEQQDQRLKKNLIINEQSQSIEGTTNPQQPIKGKEIQNQLMEKTCNNQIQFSEALFEEKQGRTQQIKLNYQQNSELIEEKQGQIQLKKQNQYNHQSDSTLNQQIISSQQEDQSQNNQQEFNLPSPLIEEQSNQLISGLEAQQSKIIDISSPNDEITSCDDNTMIIRYHTDQILQSESSSSQVMIQGQQQQLILINDEIQQNQGLPSQTQIKGQQQILINNQRKQRSQQYEISQENEIRFTPRKRKMQLKNHVRWKTLKRNIIFNIIRRKKKERDKINTLNPKTKKNNNNFKQILKLISDRREIKLILSDVLTQRETYYYKKRLKQNLFKYENLNEISYQQAITQNRRLKKILLSTQKRTKKQITINHLINLIIPHSPALTHGRMINIPNRSEKNCNHLLKFSYNSINNQKKQKQQQFQRKQKKVIIQINLPTKKTILMSNSFFQEKPTKFIKRIPSPKAKGNGEKLIVNLDFMKSPLHKKAVSLSAANIATKTLTTSMIGITDENDISVITKKVNGINIQEENTQQHDDYNTKFIEQSLLIGSTIISKEQNDNYAKFEPQLPGYRIDQFIPTIFQILQQESNKKLSNRTKVVGIFIPQIFQRFLLTTTKIDPRLSIEDLLIFGDKEQLLILLPSQTDEIHLQFFKSFYIYDLYNKVLHKEKTTTQEKWTPIRLMTEKSYIFQIFADAQEISTLLQSMNSNLLLEIGSAKLCKLSILVDSKNRPQSISKDIDIKQFDQLQKLKDFNLEYVWK